jgi:hypothetical protein
VICVELLNKSNVKSIKWPTRWVFLLILTLCVWKFKRTSSHVTVLNSIIDSKSLTKSVKAIMKLKGHLKWSKHSLKLNDMSQKKKSEISKINWSGRPTTYSSKTKLCNHVLMTNVIVSWFANWEEILMSINDALQSSSGRLLISVENEMLLD